MNQSEFLKTISKERPVASVSNKEILDKIQTEAVQMGWDVISKPFDCTKWEKGRSFIDIGNHSYEIFPSPFSKSYKGNGDIIVIRSLEELESFNINEKVVFLKDNIAKEPMQPKIFPFYYPDEHKHIIDLLEEKKPKAVIAVTGKHAMCGLDPFPMFEDGNLSIPSAFINESTANNILRENGTVNLNIDSNNSNEKSRQIIATRKAKDKAAGKIIVCAHMDTKYGTPGAIDNAAGVVILLKIMDMLKTYECIYDIDIIPFNGEEYYEVKGQLEYLDYIKDDFDAIKLVINIDSPCHKDSKTAVSTYNVGEKLSATLCSEMEKNSNIVIGDQWYAGDHAVFAFRGTPCIAVTSSNLFESVLQITHTQRDTVDQISDDMINQTAEFLTGLVKSVAEY
ncbi:peptidase M28 [Dehalococcoides mccartyi]|uniref:M28 family metallopeptidase n=1 Tax=Dehalococcoides mccartyi TaxID=61435 RepID=UPI0002B76315|nr:M28 family peptidase [Dehalococcoides mccartyi]AGG08054.1 peptidase, M28 family [Dehalococcoides mccartyi BTF08]KSV17487.1 peptidase M28 [Dehalococcoides mccartyi]